MRVIVYHGYYGCETGCCGHYVGVDDREVVGSFTFDHPLNDEDLVEFAKELVISQFGEEHVADLDWDSCMILPYEDCPS